MILTNSLDLAATCVFDVNGNHYQIDNSKESEDLDGLVTGGNTRSYLREQFGFDLKNPIVLLVLLMIGLAIMITVVAGAK